MLKILLRKFIFTLVVFSCSLLVPNSVFGQCAQTFDYIDDLQQSTDINGVCTQSGIIMWSVDNSSPQGNSSLEYAIYLVDGDGNIVETIRPFPVSGCDYTQVNSSTPLSGSFTIPDDVPNNIVVTCDLTVVLAWRGYTASGQGGNSACNGTTCDSGVFPEGALPVELVHFEAKIENDKKVKLSWSTASEQNNLGFDIQRSSDGRSWETLEFVAGRGTTNETIHYSYEDTQPLRGFNYYRLKQIDFDGQFEYSAVVTVLFESAKGELLQVFPNPSSGLFKVGLSNPNGEKAFIKLFDSTGSLIWTKQFNDADAELYWEKEFDLPQREVYLLVTQVGTHVETQKVIIIDEK